MSATKVDMPKVTQMLDAGWRVLLFKNWMGSYSAEASHHEEAVMRRTRAALADFIDNRSPPGVLSQAGIDAKEQVEGFHFDGNELVTDDFTPEQALTRLAYKAVDGEIL